MSGKYGYWGRCVGVVFETFDGVGMVAQAKKVLWFYYSFTLVFLEEIGTVKL